MRAHLDAPRRTIEQLLFLESRPVRRGVGNLVSAGAGGWVRFWECHAEGKLVAQFNAGHRPGASVTALCSDRQNFHFLVTGDSDGYIKVWYVPQYANIEAADQQPDEPPYVERFQLLRESLIVRMLRVQQGRFTPPPSASEPRHTWTAPLLVTSFHGHLNVVTSLDYVDDRDCFLSASDDQSLRMWTVYGAFVGIFGQETPWLPIEPPPRPGDTAVQTTVAAETTAGVEALSLSADAGRTSTAPTRPSTAAKFGSHGGGKRGSVTGARPWQPRRVPADIRRVASSCTLRVMYGGHVPQWRVTRAKMLAYIEVVQRVLRAAGGRSRTTTEDDMASVTSIRPTDFRLQLSDLPSVEHSSILGSSYKRQRRHRPLPTVPRVLQTDLKVSTSSLSNSLSI